MSPRFSLDSSIHNSPAESASAPVRDCGREDTPDPLAFRAVAHAASPVVPATSPDRPLDAESVFVPEAYEPNYAYPLILWLLDPSSDEHELCRRMAQISTRNYVGMAIRTPLACEGGASSTGTADAVADLEEQITESVQWIRRGYHIHSERIFLAGFSAAGTLALQLGLRRPEWFAGIAAFAGGFPTSDYPLRRFRDLRGKRVLLGCGTTDSSAAADRMAQTGRLLHTAGMRVCSRKYDAGHEIARSMLVDIDRWVMREIYRKA